MEYIVGYISASMMEYLKSFVARDAKCRQQSSRCKQHSQIQHTLPFFIILSTYLGRYQFSRLYVHLRGFACRVFVGIVHFLGINIIYTVMMRYKIKKINYLQKMFSIIYHGYWNTQLLRFFRSMTESSYVPNLCRYLLQVGIITYIYHYWLKASFYDSTIPMVKKSGAF